MRFLKTLIESNRLPTLVLSTNVKPLVRMKPMINAYEGGFAAMDKSLPISEMLKRIDFACEVPSTCRLRFAPVQNLTGNGLKF